MLVSINPATERAEGQYAEHEPAEVRRRLEEAVRAQAAWRAETVDDRAAVLRRIAAGLRKEERSLAELVTREMGKPVAQARGEVTKCAWVLDHYAEQAGRMLAPEAVETDATDSHVRLDPLGVVLAIMPWNFPLWQVFRCAAPVLVAGNVMLLKHAPNVVGTGLAIERLVERAGVPSSLLRTLVLSNEATERVIAEREVHAVTLTGSVAAGHRVAGLAGSCGKKTVLELGGSDAFIVLSDADLDRAVDAAVLSRTLNTGQSCIAAKRFLVEEPIADRFIEALVERMARLESGDPLRDDVDLGPLARADLRKNLSDQVQRSISQGAELRAGGSVPSRTGYYYPATVLTGVRPGMPAFDEETFGPVAAVTRVPDADAAVELCNRSRYGLGASLWTADLGRARTILPRIEAGAVFVNEVCKSDPRLPFGGVKDSGYGRELGTWGIREFVNAKTVWIA